MNGIIESQVFFFISSIGFIILWILTVILLVYLNRAIKTFSRIIDKAERDINEIGDTTQELLEDIRESAVFSFLFKKKKKRKS